MLYRFFTAGVVLSSALWAQGSSPLMMRNQLPSAIESQINLLEKQSDWKALDLYIRSLEPSHRMAVHATWLKALWKNGNPEGVLQLSQSALPILEKQTGPQLSVARIYQALALGALNRHPQAMEAHLENAKLGYPDGCVNACSEAQKHQDWEALITCAEMLAKQNPGLGLSFQGEALTKLKRYKEARPILEAAAQKPEATSMAWADLTLCYVEDGEYMAAIDAAQKALGIESVPIWG